jgi:chemotaxis protein methyltransferase CheR
MTIASQISTQAFAYLCELVHARSAIVLNEEKRYLVEARLGPIARAAGMDGLEDLVKALRLGRDRPLEELVVEAMTTNETSFFRDRTPFEALRSHILPERIAANAARRELTLWSAACSTGQEPYSLAILLEDAFPQLASWHVEILATDLSKGALARAEAARYSCLEVNRGLDPSHLSAYFERDGDGYRLVDKIRSRVRFRQLNLAEPWPSLPKQDVILLRNVLIYFDTSTRRRILAEARARLLPGGYLLLGAAETTRDLVEGLRPIPAGRTTVYCLEPS